MQDVPPPLDRLSLRVCGGRGGKQMMRQATLHPLLFFWFRFRQVHLHVLLSVISELITHVGVSLSLTPSLPLSLSLALSPAW